MWKQLVLERRKQESEKKKRKAEKLEELVSLLYQHLVTHHKTDNEEDALDGMIILHSKIEAITTVYFADLSNHSEAITKHAIDYYRTKKQKNESGAAEARKAYMDEHNAIVQGIKRIAQREFQ